MVAAAAVVVVVEVVVAVVVVVVVVVVNVVVTFGGDSMSASVFGIKHGQMRILPENFLLHRGSAPGPEYGWA